MSVTTTIRSAQPPIILRITAALVGGYVLTWGFIAFGMAALFAAGMDFHDAEMLTSMIGFLLFLSVFLWAFAARSLRKVWVYLAGGGIVMAGAGSLVQSALLRLA